MHNSGYCWKSRSGSGVLPVSCPHETMTLTPVLMLNQPVGGIWPFMETFQQPLKDSLETEPDGPAAATLFSLPAHPPTYAPAAPPPAKPGKPQTPHRFSEGWRWLPPGFPALTFRPFFPRPRLSTDNRTGQRTRCPLPDGNPFSYRRLCSARPT